MNRTAFVLFVLGAACAVSSCGSRPAYWNQQAPTASTYGLQEGVAVLDADNDRLVFLSALPAQQLSAQQLPLAHNPVTTSVSPDGQSLFILASGDWPIQTAADQLPSLTWVAPSPSSSTTVPPTMTATQFWMSNPLQNLVIDPGEHWAVAYAGAQTDFVQNVSELVLFDLTQAPNPSSPTAPLDKTRSPNPVSRTLQAFGGIPQQLSFTGELNLGG